MIDRRTVLLGLAGPILGPALAPGGDDDDSRGELARIEREWADAVVKSDRTTVSRFLAEDICVTDSAGYVYDRSSYLDIIGSDVADFESLKVEDLSIRLHGDTAVVLGRTVYRNGPRRPDLNGSYRFTKTYLRSDGGWRCVVAQVTRIRD